jgi:ankyrin repeat protein
MVAFKQSGTTALLYAVVMESKDVVDLLLSAGADVDIQDYVFIQTHIIFKQHTHNYILRVAFILIKF